MRVVLIHAISGTRDGIDWPPAGSVIDLPDDEAAAYMATGTVREATKDDGAPIEFAVVAPVETATAKRQKG